MELGIASRDQGNSQNALYNSSAADIILDAVIKYQFNKHWDFWAGQTLLPGNRSHLIYSGHLQFVDQSWSNEMFNVDRDAGMWLFGEFGNQFVSFQLGICNKVYSG